MKVFLYDNTQELNEFFGALDYEIPFLGSSLLKFFTMNLLRNAENLSEEIHIFIPESWELESRGPVSKYNGNLVHTLSQHQKKDYEVIFVTSLYSILASDITRDDIAYLKQNPGRLFSNNGVVGGYVEKGQQLEAPDNDFGGFDNFLVLSIDNFLGLNQQLVGQLYTPSVPNPARVYGNPIILSENIINSTVCGPSFIGENVTLNNAYIAPGTVIMGNTTVDGSRVFSSFIHDSRITSSELEDTVVTSSAIQGLTLQKSSVPRGSYIENER